MAKKRSCGFIDATESYQGETPASNMNTPVITSISSDTPACMELMESKDVKVGKKKYRATVEVRNMILKVLSRNVGDAA